MNLSRKINRSAKDSQIPKCPKEASSLTLLTHSKEKNDEGNQIGEQSIESKNTFFWDLFVVTYLLLVVTFIVLMELYY